MAEIKNVFKDQDVDLLDFPIDDSSRYGSDIMRAVSEFQVGTGDKVFRSNKQGIWLGSSSFDDAPFRVSMAGLMTLAQKIGINNFTGTPTTPYTVGDLWSQGSGGAIKVCIVSRATGAYNSTDWDLASNYQNSGQVTTIIGNTVTTGYVNALSITAGSVSANNITAGNIVGSTLSTAVSGQRVVLFSTLASYYDESNNLICSTYANGNTFWLKGERTTSNLYLGAGSSGSIAFLSGTTPKMIYDIAGNILYPTTNNQIDLGGGGYNWKTVNCVVLDTASIITNHIELAGTTIDYWSDVGSYITFPPPSSSTISSILHTDLGGVNSTTLNVRRVTTGGVDSGWYGLTFNYGLLTSATVH